MNEPCAVDMCMLPNACTALEKQSRGSLRRQNPRSTKICGFILPWTPVYNHWSFLGQSSEDTWALIKMSFMHFAKSLRSTPVATVITAILLFPELTASLAQKSPNIRGGPLKALPSVTRIWWLRVVFTALLINSQTDMEQISSLGFNKPPLALQAPRCRRWLLIYLWLRVLDVECIIRTLFQWEASSKARGSGVIFVRDNVEQSRLIGNDGIKKTCLRNAAANADNPIKIWTRGEKTGTFILEFLIAVLIESAQQPMCIVASEGW